MINKRFSSIEERLDIYEEDFVNNQDILILTCYAIKKNDNLWEFPSIQFWGNGEEVYKKNKEKYDEVIMAFRNDCIGIEYENASLLSMEIEKIKKMFKGE